MTHSPSSPRRRFSSLRSRLASAAILFAIAGCAKGDVGAPCNHGDTEPPASKLVTFPALSCNELLCVYADIAEAPPDACTVGADGNAQCNEANLGLDRFQCVADEGDTSGHCELKIEYVLQRSMCSKKCSSDSDCKDGGVGEKVVVENTKCQEGFSCARIQTLGKFCCEKLCVCNDDLDLSTANMIQEDCAAGTQDGCCVDPTKPDFVPSPACGKN